MTNDTIHVDTESEHTREVTQLQAAGYTKLQTTKSETTLAEPSPGSKLVHVALLVVTLGVGNIIYYLYNQSNRETITVVTTDD